VCEGGGSRERESERETYVCARVCMFVFQIISKYIFDMLLFLVPWFKFTGKNSRAAVLFITADLNESCARGGSEERGRVLWDATSRGLCGRDGPPRTNVRVAWANCERGQPAPPHS
jgi:hypothetical protein